MQHVEVTSVEQLEGILDRLAAVAMELETAFNVTLDGPDDTSMDIVVGAPIASVQWIREDPWDCQVSVSPEHDHDDSLIEFAGNGQHSELERRWWINVPVARAALRHYFLTGGLTRSVRWEAL
jgi:hypothetical protein